MGGDGECEEGEGVRECPEGTGIASVVGLAAPTVGPLWTEREERLVQLEGEREGR